MDYQEAINKLQHEKGLIITGNARKIEDFFEALDISISVMQELQMYKQIDQECIQKTGCGLNMLAHKYLEFVDDITELYKYREIGTLEELKKLKECELSGIELAEIACSLNLLKAYQQIGTLEEVQEAVEKQNAKELRIMYGMYGRVYLCNECGNEFELSSQYCPFCGQKQEW